MPVYTQAQTGVPQGLALNQKQPGENPNVELLRQSFQQMLQKQQLMEKANAPAARQLAKAYVNRPEAMLAGAGLTAPGLHATPYSADKVKPVPWSEDEVYKALVGGLDMTKLEKGNNAANWVWKPTPIQTGTRDDVLTETGKWAMKTYLGGTNLEEIFWAQVKETGKDIATEFVVNWFEKRGLTIAAELESGIGTILGIYELTCSVLELLIVLMKPENRAMSKDEAIVVAVRRWLSDEQTAAQAAQKEAQEEADFKERLKNPLKLKTYVTERDKTRIGS
jgi:hypothetical protein